MERFKKICKILLWPHWVLIALLAVACGAGLGWVFISGREESWIAYPIYVLSAYTLTAVCIALMPVAQKWVARAKEKKASQTAEDVRKKMRISLYQSLGINFIYAVFKIVSGILYQSSWLWSSGLYYMVLSLIRFVLALYERKVDKVQEPARKELLGWKGFRACGFMLLILNLTMSGMVFQLIWRGTGSNYPEVVAIAIAAYTFYRLTIAILQVLQIRKKRTPIQGAARNVSLTTALMSLFSLQTALFSTFGSEFEQQFLMNTLTGGAVCLLAVLGALGMVIHGNNRKKEIIGDGEHE